MVVASGNAAWRALRLRAAALCRKTPGPKSGWLILVPHPDDETLGAGSLISRLAAQKRPAWVVFLTSGDASHGDAPGWPAERIAMTRQREALHALKALGHPHRRTLFLNWPDGRPFVRNTEQFKKSIDILTRLCRKDRLGNIAVTWRGEGHCDHQAAFQLADALARQNFGSLRIFEYLVWGWTNAELRKEVRAFDAFEIDDPGHRGSHAMAISSHRTQLSPIIQNAGHGFRLPETMVSLATRDPMIFIRKRQNHAT